MKTKKKLTVDEFSLYRKLEERRNKLLYFANYDNSDHISLSYYAWSISRTISFTLIDEFSVINAAQKEARRLALQIQDEMDSLTQSDYNTMEKEKQRRRFGRAEIILIIQLVTICAMTAIALILNN